MASAPWAAALACFGVGLLVAPILISSFAAASESAQPGSTLTPTLLATGTVVGVAAGTTAAGFAVDLASATAALANRVLVGLVCAALGFWVRRRRLRE